MILNIFSISIIMQYQLNILQESMIEDKQNMYQQQPNIHFQSFSNNAIKQKSKNMKLHKLNIICDSKLKKNIFFEEESYQIDDYDNLKVIQKDPYELKVVNLVKQITNTNKQQHKKIEFQNKQQVNQKQKVSRIQSSVQKEKQKILKLFQFAPQEFSQQKSELHLIKQQKNSLNQSSKSKFIVQDFGDKQPLESVKDHKIIENTQIKKNFLVEDFGFQDVQDKTIQQNSDKFEQINLIENIPQNLSIKEFLRKPIPKGYLLQCTIKRTSSVYHLYISKTYVHLMSAKKRNCSTSSSYIYSLDKNLFEKADDSYLGKLRSNFFGTLFNAYDDGVNPKQFKNNVNRIRSNIVSVEYQTNILGLNGPRKMKINIPNLNQNENMIEIRPETEQQNLTSEKYKHLVKNFINKPPKWDSNLSAYVLNFHGRANLTSVKNFLIVQQGNDKEYLLFGRVGQDIFNLDIQYPFSVLQGFSIVLSSFDKKFSCE